MKNEKNRSCHLKKFIIIIYKIDISSAYLHLTVVVFLVIEKVIKKYLNPHNMILKLFTINTAVVTRNQLYEEKIISAFPNSKSCFF